VPPTSTFHSQTETKSASVKPDLSKSLDSKFAGPFTKSELPVKIKRPQKPRTTNRSSTLGSSEPEVIEIDDEDENVKSDGDVKISEDAEMEDGDASPAKATHLQPSSVEEVDDRATSGVQTSSRLANKHRPAPLAPRPGNASNGLLPPTTAFKSTSPVIPSPLRHVSLPPDDDDDEAPDATSERQQASSVSDTAMKDTKDAVSLSSSPKSQALRVPLQELNAFEILLPTSIAAIQTLRNSRQSSEALGRAIGLPEVDFPKYDFTFPRDSKPDRANSTIPVIKTTSASPSTSPSPAPFDFAAAGFKPQPTTAGTRTCSICACQCPLSAEKCTVCDSPKSGDSVSSTSPSLPIQPDKTNDTRLTNGIANTSRASFDWGAAGLAKPVVPSDAWTCSICGIQNAGDKQKCMACEVPSPKASQPASPKPSVASFDWAAAGLKPKDIRNTWTCGTCMVTNDEDSAKCIACEGSRP